MKTILVIDVPTESLENIFASAVICEQREGYNVVIKRLGKMNLKPMPMKSVWKNDYSDGWNDCLKEITE